LWNNILDLVFSEKKILSMNDIWCVLFEDLSGMEYLDFAGRSESYRWWVLGGERKLMEIQLIETIVWKSCSGYIYGFILSDNVMIPVR